MLFAIDTNGTIIREKEKYICTSIWQHLAAFGSICQHLAAYGSIRNFPFSGTCMKNSSIKAETNMHFSTIARLQWQERNRLL